MGNRYSLHLLTAGVLFAAFGMTAEPAWSESWPERTVHMVTPFTPGISVDVAARARADALAKQWKQPVVVENRPGADTMTERKRSSTRATIMPSSSPRTARSL